MYYAKKTFSACIISIKSSTDRIIDRTVHCERTESHKETWPENEMVENFQWFTKDYV